jgi:diacylglycerol kinase family enzyme
MPGSLVVINPHASRARQPSTLAALTVRVEEVLTARDGTAPRIVETASAGAVGPLVTEALAEGVAAVIGVGGDGTMRDIAGVLAGTEVPLGIIPAGTGNQVAAVLGVPSSPAQAIDLLGSAAPRTLDMGAVTVRRADGSTETSTFLLGCGAGFDAELMATTSAGLKRRIGTAAYFAQGARLALRMSATRCRITIDGREIETEVTTALVGNMGELVPGWLGLRLPLDPADGLLDLIVVKGKNPVRGIGGLLDQLRRTELGGDAGDGSLRLRGGSIDIEPLEAMTLQIDGDPIGEGSFSTRIRPAALQVLQPTS